MSFRKTHIDEGNRHILQFVFNQISEPGYKISARHMLMRTLKLAGVRMSVKDIQGFFYFAEEQGHGKVVVDSDNKNPNHSVVGRKGYVATAFICN